MIIFVLPDEVLERYFAGLMNPSLIKYRRETEEYLCSSVCVEATKGLYVSGNEIVDDSLILPVLRYVLGLEP